ncbi:hypothetical protein Hanom_Chr11g01012751 [Helianthus anomalus]
MFRLKVVGYSGAWVGAFVDTLNGSPPSPPSDVSAGYGGTWVGLGLGAPRGILLKKITKIYKRGQRIEDSQLGCHPRPTPDLKPKPQGPRPNPSPPGVVAWAFSPNPRPNPRPIPHSLKACLLIETKIHHK